MAGVCSGVIAVIAFQSVRTLSHVPHVIQLGVFGSAAGCLICSQCECWKHLGRALSAPGVSMLGPRAGTAGRGWPCRSAAGWLAGWLVVYMHWYCTVCTPGDTQCTVSCTTVRMACWQGHACGPDCSMCRELQAGLLLLLHAACWDLFAVSFIAPGCTWWPLRAGSMQQLLYSMAATAR